jgi:hypothetical protein
MASIMPRESCDSILNQRIIPPINGVEAMIRELEIEAIKINETSPNKIWQSK